MAETCIVCLGDLALSAGGAASQTGPELAAASLELEFEHGVDMGDQPPHVAKLDTPASAPTPLEDESVAHLLPCGHNLHNACLKPWVERANSCPICRASFNMVELREHVGGPMTSSYAVQDKQQVAEIDPSMLVDDELLEDDGSYDACMICDEFGDSSQLMYCFSCEQLCHVFCAGLDRMPTRGAWYCQGCVENPELIAAATSRATPRSPAAYINGRSRLRRRGAPDEWVGVWQTVWDRLHFDLEFPFEDDDQQSENRSEIQKREHDEWERRFALARQMGAGNRFRAAADNVHVRQTPGSWSRASTRLHRETPKTPKDPESQEELRAWNLFEKAREKLTQHDEQSSASNNTNTNSRRRKRKSADSSPAESEPQDREPERKFKRPRTRLNTETGESSAAAARRDISHDKLPPLVPEAKDDGDSSNATGFLQSLLKEVEVDRFAERDREIAAPQPKRIIVDRACSPQNSSPGLSPVYHAPLGIATPPPLTLSRPRSLSLGDEPQHSPTYSPYSPAEEDARHGHHNLPFRSHRPQGLSSPPRSKDSSPTRAANLSYSTKAELQRMVTKVLKPLYAKKEISKNHYTEINRDVSRLMYDRVGDAGAAALADHETRRGWQKMAADEVDLAVGALQSRDNERGAASSGMGDDSASSSS